MDELALGIGRIVINIMACIVGGIIGIKLGNLFIYLKNRNKEEDKL